MENNTRKWTIDIIEEWLQIAALVDKALPPVYRKGVSGQRYDIQRTWVELLWDAEDLKDRTPKWEPTNQQISMWEEVILRWLPRIKSGTDRKILWLRSAGGKWTRIGKVVNITRGTVAKRYIKALTELAEILNNPDTKIS